MSGRAGVSSPDFRTYGVYLFLDLADSDEAKYLIASYPLSVSHPKK
jgi:hypothetical protein